MQFTVIEMHTKDAGDVFELGEELGCKPHACGVNSVRRNCAVQLSQALDALGRTQTTVKKVMQHATAQGTSCFEEAYDTAPSAIDLGALQMGRTTEAIESLRSMLTTRVPSLVGLRRFSDMAETDPVRLRVFNGDAERLRTKSTIEALKRLVAQVEEGGGGGDGGGDAAVAAGGLAKLREKLAKLKKDLENLEHRLRYKAIDTKRWEVWEASARAFDQVTAEELARRCDFENVSELRMADVLLQWGCAVDRSGLIAPAERKWKVQSAEEQRRRIESAAAARGAPVARVRAPSAATREAEEEAAMQKATAGAAGARAVRRRARRRRWRRRRGGRGRGARLAGRARRGRCGRWRRGRPTDRGGGGGGGAGAG